MAAATKLTAELLAEVERELAEGVSVAFIAQRQGIARRTLHRWIADGRVTRASSGLRRSLRRGGPVMGASQITPPLASRAFRPLLDEMECWTVRG